jgi:hypothetical protein
VNQVTVGTHYIFTACVLRREKFRLATPPNNPPPFVTHASNDEIRQSESCYHDSGANRHVFHNRAVFTDYQRINPIVVQGFSSGLTTTATGIGSVTLRGWYNDSSHVYTLRDCLHIPNGHVNLISQICLDCFNITTSIANGTITLSLTSVPIIGGMTDPVTQLYKLNLTPLYHSVASSRVFTTVSASHPSGFYIASWGI